MEISGEKREERGERGEGRGERGEGRGERDALEKRSRILCIDASIPIGLLLISSTNKMSFFLYAPSFPARRGQLVTGKWEREEERGGIPVMIFFATTN